jgi:hypothetical protein
VGRSGCGVWWEGILWAGILSERALEIVWSGVVCVKVVVGACMRHSIEVASFWTEQDR